MLPVSLDCRRPVSRVPNVASFSGLSSSCVSCTQCCQFLWIVFVLCLVYPMLPVSLDCRRPVSRVPNVASFSGLSFLYCPFSFLQYLSKELETQKLVCLIYEHNILLKSNTVNTIISQCMSSSI
jgi:hypothetical protein